MTVFAHSKVTRMARPSETFHDLTFGVSVIMNFLFRSTATPLLLGILVAAKSNEIM
jgi:hypothetical protein